MKKIIKVYTIALLNSSNTNTQWLRYWKITPPVGVHRAASRSSAVEIPSFYETLKVHCYSIYMQSNKIHNVVLMGEFIQHLC